MTRADGSNSTAMRAVDAGAINSPGLARQQRQREKAIRRIAKLKIKAAAEIERLLAVLDACDPYVTTEFRGRWR